MLLEGEGSIQILDGTEVLISVDVEEGYILQSLIVDGTNVTSQIESGAYTFIMPKHAVTITATAAIPTGDQYKLFSGDLVEGDYIVYYNGKAMNTTVDGDRLQYVEVTPANDVITTDNAAIVWHIAKSGDYWTIYNAEAEAYAASTGAKNKAQMLEDGTDDKVLWTVTLNEDGTYEFVNKQNTANKVNANLRNNGEYGFACYATSTGGALSLYKKVDDDPVSVTLNKYGYATLYYSDKAFIVPEGVTATTYNNNVEVSKTYEAEDVIPAGEAVVLKGTENAKVSFVETTTTVEPDANNALKGLDVAGTTVGDGKFYMLSAKNGKVGFYYGAAEGAAFETTAHKAYLVIPASKAKEAYYLNDEVTGIQKIDNTLFSTDKIYNLNGQRVDKNYKGVVIVNGKKMINK